MSGAIRIVAEELNYYKQIELENPKSLHITATLDSPAESMSAILSPSVPPALLGAVKAFEGNRLLFEGRVDSQKSTISESGIITQLDARSRGALLLDNQAQPCVMLGAQITSVFNRFIAPYDFLLYCPKKSGYLPMYTVRTGMSEWEALVYFARRVYGVTPYVTASQVMMQRPNSGSKPFVISNTREGDAYISLTRTFTPYNILSQVYLRDEFGRYSSVVNNSAAARTKTRRKRFVIPPNEYMDKPGLDANQRIRQSLFASEQVVVTMPGAIDIKLGHDTQIADKLLTLYNLMVVAREYIINENGIITRLTLASSVYYD